MTERALRSVREPNDDAQITARMARNARIDKLGVNRSRFDGMPLTRWSPEAESRESIRQAERAAFTVQDRIQAYRQLFALTGR